MNNRLRLAWRTLLRFVAGPADVPFRQIHNTFLFLATIFLLLSLLANQVMEITPYWFNVGLAVLAPVVFALWMWSRFVTSGFQLAGISFVFLLSVVILPLTWFANGGLNGPTILFYFATLLYAAGLLQNTRKTAFTVLALIAVTPVVLIGIEYNFPQWIHGYASGFARVVDLSFSYLLVLSMLGILVLGHFRRFDEELRRSQKLASRLRHLADHDGLTRLFNHRAGLERAMALHREGRLHALLFCDLDHFKSINDCHGHPYGDRILRTFARLLKQTCAHFDAESARYGGEEFLIIITHSDHQISAIDRYLRERVRGIDLPHGDITFSSGGTRVAPYEAVDNALIRADHALYKAKRAGRDRLVIMSHTCRPTHPGQTTHTKHVVNMS